MTTVMSSLQQIKEEFLVCPICSEHYKDPKLLPCLHTFCGHCLLEFVQMTKPLETVSQNGHSDQKQGTVIFTCPVCKTDTDFVCSEDGSRIISGYSDNYMISNLMEKIDMHKAEQICESCSARTVQGQKPAKAEVWCQDCKVSFCDSCIKAHNVIKACREHIVLSLREIRVNPLESMQQTKREIPCSEHKDKFLEFYCLDCRVALCATCVAVQHRRCEMVETCADSAQKLKPETEHVLRDLDTQEKSLTDWEQEHLREIDELEENKVELVTEIKKVRKLLDSHLQVLEKSALKELDVKHANAVKEVRERLNEIEGLKKNLENTNRFLRHLVQYGSDSEFLSVFDKVKQQIIEMNTGINRRKIAKLSFRHKFALDGNISRAVESKALGKIVDIVDMNKDSFPMNGEDGTPIAPVRRTSIKRTGTFRVEKTPEEQKQEQEQHQQRKQQQQQETPPNQTPNTPPQQTNGNGSNSVHSTPRKASSRSSLSTASPASSSDSMSSQDMLDANSKSNTLSLRRRQQATCARLAAGSTGSLPRPKRVQSSVEFRKTQQILQPTKTSKTPPTQRRAQSTVNGRPPTGGDTPVRPERRSKTPDNSLLSPGISRRTKESILSPPLARKTEIVPPPSPKSPRSPQAPKPTPITEKTNAQLLCSFNGRTENDSKKCWPLDVTVLCDGTPVITDFHNKKIKAFDATGTVMCDVLLPSWPHGIANVEKSDVAVTLPEISTLVFVAVGEKNMLLQKRIKTVKQYRGISCHETADNNNTVIVVSCCATNNQSVDVLSLDGEILHSYRQDNRQPGRNLFTWPYYVTTNMDGEIIVSDCETKTGLLYLDKNGDVKHDYLSMTVVIQDPRGICTDLDGNVYLADKSAHAIHSLTADGHYRKCVVSASDELHQPIAVCVSPFGHIIVTQDNGDIKVYAID